MLKPLTVFADVFSHGQLFATPWTIAHQVPLSMEFSRHEYWSGLPFPPPGDLPEPGTEPVSLKSPALASGLFTTETPGKPNLANKKKDDNNKNLNIERDVGWALEIHT